MLRNICAALMFYLMLGPAHGFESWEHKRLSDLAYHVAVQIHCSDAHQPEFCANLREEFSISVSKASTLYQWCSQRPSEPNCVDLRSLYQPFPKAQFETSALRTYCSAVPNRYKPICQAALRLKNATLIEEPIDFSKEYGIRSWCMARSTDPFCEEIARRITEWTVKTRSIKRICNLGSDGPACQTEKMQDLDLLARISFYDPLAPNVNAPAPDDPNAKRVSLTDSELSYGDVTKCVDFFLTPEKLMAGSEGELWKKTSDKASDRKLFPLRRKDLDILVNERCSTSYWNLEGARSGHVNHTHFQSELLIAQRSYHMLALTLHAIEDNTFGALTANAISDHYLQDSMAPGHITTWRSRLTDLAANAYHDEKNRSGIYVALDGEVFGKMMTLTSGESPSTIYDRFAELIREDNPMSDAQRVREHFLYSGQRERDCTAHACEQENKDGREQARKIIEVIDKLKKKIGAAGASRASACVSSKENCVLLRGDDRLWKKDQDEQRLVMLLMQIRSILDVLESKQSADHGGHYILADSFKDNSWNWTALDEAPQNSLSRLLPARSELKAKIGAVKYDIPQTNQMGVENTHSYQARDPVLGVSVEVDNMTFGEQQNRKLIVLESVLMGAANEKRGSYNGAILGGIMKSYEPQSNSYGIGVRFAFVFPQTETIFSLPVRALRLGVADDKKKWRPTIGLRFDQGFTSFATMFLQLTRDNAAQRDGSIRSGWSAGAGLQLAAPTCRIPGLKSIACD